jgi:GT2 family glycosyltransferase
MANPLIATTTNMELVADDRARRYDGVFDLLAEPFEAQGVIRSSCQFTVTQPWSVARFGRVTLGRGWWMFECAGEGDVGGVELRLVSPEDTLLAFSLRRAAKGRAMFPTERHFDVSLLVSPWPGSAKLSVLRLRRMTKAEEARMVGGLMSRLFRSERPLSKLVHIASRVLGGRSLRIQKPISPPVTNAAVEAVTAEHANFVTIEREGVTAVLRTDERLHLRAMEIAAASFARVLELKAVYADLDAAGIVRPHPAWDGDLAAAMGYAGPPVFFRGKAEAIDPRPRLAALAAEAGAVARIALPLARRDSPVMETFSPKPAPRLERLPSVSIIVPTKTRPDMLEKCLIALAERTGYPPLDVVLVDNGADTERIGTITAVASNRLQICKVDDFGPFNFSRLINLGVRHSRGEILLLLNDDIEAIETGWLHRLVDSAMAPGVGCVGARLLYPDRTIQHAGVMLGLSGVCGHLWKGLGEKEARTIPQVMLPSGRMAVTGACLAIRRETFDRVKGLDEQSFPVAFNDIDFCLRVREAGFRTIYRGDAVLIHHESQSRGSDDATRERRTRLAQETSVFLARWGHLLGDDPFGSPAFDPATESGAIHPSLR